MGNVWPAGGIPDYIQQANPSQWLVTIHVSLCSLWTLCEQLYTLHCSLLDRLPSLYLSPSPYIARYFILCLPLILSLPLSLSRRGPHVAVLTVMMLPHALFAVDSV